MSTPAPACVSACRVSIAQVSIKPPRARIGDSVTICFHIRNTAAHRQNVLVDFQVHYIKANGCSSAKVFKLRALELVPGQTVPLKKTVSLAEMSTRRHYAGPHRVELLVNGRIMPLGSFDLLPGSEA